MKLQHEEVCGRSGGLRITGIQCICFRFPPLHPPLGPKSQSGGCEKEKWWYNDAADMEVLTVGDTK